MPSHFNHFVALTVASVACLCIADKYNLARFGNVSACNTMFFALGIFICAAADYDSDEREQCQKSNEVKSLKGVSYP